MFINHLSFFSRLIYTGAGTVLSESLMKRSVARHPYNDWKGMLFSSFLRLLACLAVVTSGWGYRRYQIPSSRKRNLIVMNNSWQKSIDESLVGLLKWENQVDWMSLPPLPSAPLSFSSVLTLPVPSVTFPALSSQVNMIMDYAEGNNNIGRLFIHTTLSPSLLLTRPCFTDEAMRIITENIQKFVTFFDISHLPLLSINQQEYLVSNVDLSVRVLMGLGLLEVIPFVLNIILVKIIFNNMFKVDPSNVNFKNIPQTYDKTEIIRFYSDKPTVFIGRFIEILAISKDLLYGLLTDAFDSSQKISQEEIRARQIKETVTKLGTIWIKISQSLSMRPDLLSPVIIKELQSLQDAVAPFDTKIAIGIIKNELNINDLSEIFVDSSVFSAKPVASASLGQVYKAQLKESNLEVAVKIQRPNMLLYITLDLYIINMLLEFLSQFRAIREEAKSVISLIDVWASRFLDELDYGKELQNSLLFKEQMNDSSITNSLLNDAIVVPKVFKDISSKKVLVSEWINGEKLTNIDISKGKNKELVLKLTKLLLNSYLVQLLNTGFLHSDPHAGNFLVNTDGKLVILDYGLMTTIDEDKRYAIISYICNLLAKDYDATLEDLIVLGFIPEEVVSESGKKQIVAPILAQVLEQLSDGGGAASFDVGQVSQQIEILSKQYPIIIPSYFGLIFRAFGALEGLGLSADPNYSIVKECLPYIATKLLSDTNPKTETALKKFLYNSNRDGSGNSLNIKRLNDMAIGYSQFIRLKTDAKEGTWLDNKTNSKASLDPAVQSISQIILNDGNYVQDIIVEEAVRITDALTRSVITTISRNLRSFLYNDIGFNENPGLFSSLTRPTAQDIQALQTLKTILSILVTIESSDDVLSVKSKDNSRRASTSGQGLVDLDDIELALTAISRLQLTTSATFPITIETIQNLYKNLPKINKLLNKFARSYAKNGINRLINQLS